MGEKIEFKGCKHLDYRDNYAAEKNAINVGGETKVCWNRPTIDKSYPSLVQFCKIRGRLNHPEACLSEACKMCSDYEDELHNVTISN